MSEPISALNHASYEGIAKVEECGLQGMITLRGDLSDKVLAKAVKDATGQNVPGQREALVNGDTGVCWMSTDELLVLVPYAEVEAEAGRNEQRAQRYTCTGRQRLGRACRFPYLGRKRARGYGQAGTC